MKMNLKFELWKMCALASFLSFSLAVYSCAGHQAPVQPNPTEQEALQVRIDGAVAADNFKTAATIIRQVAAFADSAPLPTNVKDAIDCSIVKAMGTTNGPSAATVKVCGAGVPNGPGPVVAVTKLIGSVTTKASLKSTIATAMPYINDVLKTLEASDNVSLKALALALRSAVAFAAAL